MESEKMNILITNCSFKIGGREIGLQLIGVQKLWKEHGIKAYPRNRRDGVCLKMWNPGRFIGREEDACIRSLFGECTFRVKRLK